MKVIAKLKKKEQAEKLVALLSSMFGKFGADFWHMDWDKYPGLVSVCIDIDLVPDYLHNSVLANAEFVATGFLAGVCS